MWGFGLVIGAGGLVVRVSADFWDWGFGWFLLLVFGVLVGEWGVSPLGGVV